jgi:hypothetical protein
LSCCCAFCAVFGAFCAVLSGCHLSSYVDKYERITLGRVIGETKCPTQACIIPTSFSRSADVAADGTPLLTGTVAGATKEARRSTSCISTRPAPNDDDDDDNDTQQLVLSRSNGVVGPNPPPPASSSPPLERGSWSSQGRTVPSDLTHRRRHCPHPPSHSRCHGDGCRYP